MISANSCIFNGSMADSIVPVIILIHFERMIQFIRHRQNYERVFNMLLSGYLLAYLIYLVDHHAEEMRAFRKIYPIVGQHIVDIINTGKGIIHNMANVQNINEIADYPDEKTVFQIFDNLKLGDRTAPMVDSKNLKKLTWIEYISYVNLYNGQNIMAIFFSRSI